MAITIWIAQHLTKDDRSSRMRKLIEFRSSDLGSWALVDRLRKFESLRLGKFVGGLFWEFLGDSTSIDLFWGFSRPPRSSQSGSRTRRP